MIFNLQPVKTVEMDIVQTTEEIKNIDTVFEVVSRIEEIDLMPNNKTDDFDKHKDDLPF